MWQSFYPSFLHNSGAIQTPDTAQKEQRVATDYKGDVQGFE
jgi:hypothetical protein